MKNRDINQRLNNNNKNKIILLYHFIHRRFSSAAPRISVESFAVLCFFLFNFISFVCFAFSLLAGCACAQQQQPMMRTLRTAREALPCCVPLFSLPIVKSHHTGSVRVCVCVVLLFLCVDLFIIFYEGILREPLPKSRILRTHASDGVVPILANLLQASEALLVLAGGSSTVVKFNLLQKRH